jgi:hypothetical protein
MLWTFFFYGVRKFHELLGRCRGEMNETNTILELHHGLQRPLLIHPHRHRSFQTYR